MANGTLAASQIEMLSQSGTGVTTIVPPATNTDRTLTLPDNTGTVITTASTGAVAQAMLETLVVPIGVGQTWTNVAASRASGVVYTNSTGRPIMVSVCAGVATYSYIDIYVDGVEIFQMLSRDTATTTSGSGAIFIVPAGSTYQAYLNANGSTAVGVWYELR